MYSDIKQGDDESIDKLDQRIKNLVEKCQYTEAENWYIEPNIIPCDQALQGKKVGSVEETVRRRNVHRTTSVRQRTWDDGERF